MGPLEIHLNGAPSGAGFVIVSSPEQPLPATLSLRTTDGSEGDVECRPGAESGAKLSISPSTAHVSGMPVVVQTLASTPSAGQNDTTIEVVQGGNVLAQFALTALERPLVRFRGRFQCRLATDLDDWFHPWGVDSSFSMYAVQSADVLPPNAPPDEPPLDRIIRFQDIVAQRPFCDPIGVAVTQIEAEVAGTPLVYTAGDPIIGLPVRLGPDCKFDARNETYAPNGFEPISDFRLSIEPVFAGRSAPGAPRLPGQDRPTTAPYGDGFLVLDELDSWVPSDFGYEEATWAEHAQVHVEGKLNKLKTEPLAGPRDVRINARRVQEHEDSRPGHGMGAMRFAMERIERYTGLIDRDLLFAPHADGVLAYLSSLPAIQFVGEFFDFDSDCQCGTVTGTLGAPREIVALASPLASPAGPRVAPGAVND
jgi:hypothetical protein